MKTHRFFALFIATIFLANTSLVKAQDQKDTNLVKAKKSVYNTWSATLSGGSMLFYGDLRQYDFYPVGKSDYPKDISERKLGFGLAVNKQLTPLFGVQGFLQSGELSGFRRSVKAYFNTSFLAYGVNATLNISNLFNSSKENRKFKFYGFAGLGYVDFKAKQQRFITDATIHSEGYGEFGQEDKKTTELVIPVGLGVKYMINKRFDIGLESSLNNVNSDKLDARAVKNTARDKYGYTCLTLTYKIGKNEKSLEWVSDKEMEADELTPKFDSTKKMLDSLAGKLSELENKVNALQKDVNDLKNPPVEADDDTDGVPNSKDLEPETAQGSLVNFQGITIPKSSAGVGAASQLQLLNSIYFPVNSSYIDAANEEKVADAAKLLKDNPNLKLEIVGHADKTGGQKYNQILSEKRAKAVRDKLVKSYNVNESRLTVTGKGINDPISNDVLGVNRRVDFIVK